MNHFIAAGTAPHFFTEAAAVRTPGHPSPTSASGSASA